MVGRAGSRSALEGTRRSGRRSAGSGDSVPPPGVLPADREFVGCRPSASCRGSAKVRRPVSDPWSESRTAPRALPIPRGSSTRALAEALRGARPARRGSLRARDDRLSVEDRERDQGAPLVVGVFECLRRVIEAEVAQLEGEFLNERVGDGVPASITPTRPSRESSQPPTS